jgi:WD40 repeat protein
MKCLDKDRNRRYETANGLVTDLQRYLHDEPVLACPPSAAYRLRKFLRRHKASMLAGFSLVVTLLLGLVLVVTSNYQINQALAERTSAFNQLEDEQEKTAQALHRETALKTQETKLREQLDDVLDQERLALYYYRIHLADRELGLGHVAKTEQLLGECPARFRHWEWHYLAGLCHKDLLTLRGLPAPANAVAVSPDGTRLAAVSPDFTARVWDTPTGKQLHVLALPRPRLDLAIARHIDKGIRSVLFTPDGRQLITAGSIGCQVWDVATGERLPDLPVAPPVPPAQQAAARPIALSPDGQRLAAAVGTGTALRLEVWDLKTGKKERDLGGHKKTIWSVAFSSDGKRIVSAGEEPVVKVWDAVTGDRLLDLKVADLKPDDEFFCRAEFSPDGDRVVTAGSDRLVRVWDARKGTELRTLVGHTGLVYRAVFSPNGKEIASAGGDRTVRRWDAAAGRPLAVYRGHDAAVLDVVFWPDGRRLASASADRTVKVWDAASVPEYRAIRLAPPPPDRVTVVRPVLHLDTWGCLAWSPDGRHLAADGSRTPSAGKLGDLLVFDAETLEPAPPLRGHSQPLTRLAYSPDGRYLASASLDKSVIVWDATTARKLHALEVTPVHGMTFSTDSRRLPLTTQQTAAAYDAATGREIARVPLPAWTNTSPVYSPDGRHVAGIDDKNGTLKVWDTVAAAEVCSVDNNERSTRSAVFSPDGQLLAANYREGKRETVGEWCIKLWSARSGKALATLRGHTAASTGLAWSPDGKRLASGDSDGSMKIWDTATGRELLSFPTGTGSPRLPAFSPDGTRLAAVSADGLLKIWDATPRTERPASALTSSEDKYPSR